MSAETRESLQELQNWCQHQLSNFLFSPRNLMVVFIIQWEVFPSFPHSLLGVFAQPETTGAKSKTLSPAMHKILFFLTWVHH